MPLPGDTSAQLRPVDGIADPQRRELRTPRAISGDHAKYQPSEVRCENEFEILTGEQQR